MYVCFWTNVKLCVSGELKRIPYVVLLSFMITQLGEQLRDLYRILESEPLGVFLGFTTLDRSPTSCHRCPQGSARYSACPVDTSPGRVKLGSSTCQIGVRDKEMRSSPAIAGRTCETRRDDGDPIFHACPLHFFCQAGQRAVTQGSTLISYRLVVSIRNRTRHGRIEL